MPNACRRMSRLVRVFVPSWIASPVIAARPGMFGGSLARPDRIVSVTDTFGTTVWRVTITRSPFGSVFSIRGAS